MDIAFTITFADGAEINNVTLCYQRLVDLNMLDPDAMPLETWISNAIQAQLTMLKSNYARQAKEVIVAITDVDDAIATKTGSWSRPIIKNPGTLTPVIPQFPLVK